MRIVRSKFHEFDDDEKLMWVWHVTSSIRPSEIFRVRSEETEYGEDPDDIDTATGKERQHITRFVRLAKGKNKYAKRSIPIPQAVLDLNRDDGSSLLPPKITGPLFRRNLKPLLVSINNKLEKWGVKDTKNGKSFYSGRHRAKDRLVNRGLSDDEMRKAIMGHARRISAHDGYGHGYAMYKVKFWIDKIGW
jgi:integrase